MSDDPKDSLLELLKIVNDAIGRVSSSFDSIPKGRIEIPEISESDGSEERRKALRKVLEELSSLDRGEYLSDSDIDDLARFFEGLYGGEPKYRHSYADICDVIFGYAESEAELDEGVPYQVNNLANNVNLVYSRMGHTTTQAESVQKLCDHIELERTRLRHFVDQRDRIREYDRKREELERSAERDRERNAEQAREDRENLERDFAKRVDAMRMEFIAILGVFAAIVLAFNGAVGFSTSSIQALGTAGGIRALVFIAALVGFVLVNAISILMVFLWKMAFGKRVVLGTWPRNCLILTEVVLILVMFSCVAMSHPVIRALFGLPA